MHDRLGYLSVAIRAYRTRWARSVALAAPALIFFAALFVLVCPAAAQDTLPPAMEACASDPARLQ